MATVLLVEDNRDIADTLKYVLELEGHIVRTAYDGAAGLIEGRRCTPQVAILDIGLPHVDGFEVARGLREMHGDAIVLVACTGYADVPMRNRIADVGFDHVFTKPVPMEALLDALRRCLS